MMRTGEAQRLEWPIDWSMLIHFRVACASLTLVTAAVEGKRMVELLLEGMECFCLETV